MAFVHGALAFLEQVLWVGEKWARSYVLERECRREIVAGGSPDARWEPTESIPLSLPSNKYC